VSSFSETLSCKGNDKGNDAIRRFFATTYSCPNENNAPGASFLALCCDFLAEKFPNPPTGPSRVPRAAFTREELLMQAAEHSEEEPEDGKPLVSGDEMVGSDQACRSIIC
jgi:hypothetical protein